MQVDVPLIWLNDIRVTMNLGALLEQLRSETKDEEPEEPREPKNPSRASSNSLGRTWPDNRSSKETSNLVSMESSSSDTNKGTDWRQEP